ncbi:MAG: hypothetical protein H7836_07270 [Magnetococcus sp. YQC-3]
MATSSAERSPFSVHPYSKETLADLFAKYSGGDLRYISGKVVLHYFSEYFSCSDLAAKTIVVESRYIDHDFLEDYAGYYARCFSPYLKNCSRLHFFSKSFTEQAFRDFLAKARDPSFTSQELQSSYLGFIVVKPLPRKMIGKTCLRTYRDDGGRRYFIRARSYEVNLFGHPLSVDHSLAFQEQDSVAAACATSALWTVLQGTGKLFQHIIPSPIAITRSATQYISPEQRPFPNHGLNLPQMAHAIRGLGMESHLIGLTEHGLDRFRQTAYAYLRGDIPCVLAFALYDCSNETGDAAYQPNGLHHFMGYHAVALTGFSLPRQGKMARNGSSHLPRLVATGMDKIYVHDDGVGPFARMEFDDKWVVVGSQDNNRYLASLSTSWRGGRGNSPIGSGRAVLTDLLIPLYPKIRIPFACILERVAIFHDFLRCLDEINPFIGSVTWDIHISQLNPFKESVVQNQKITGEPLLKILTATLPRFLWRAKLLQQGQEVLELLFDATDFQDGHLFLQGIIHDRDFFNLLSNQIKTSKRSDLDAIIDFRPVKDILDWVWEEMGGTDTSDEAPP